MHGVLPGHLLLRGESVGVGVRLGVQHLLVLKHRHLLLLLLLQGRVVLCCTHLLKTCLLRRLMHVHVLLLHVLPLHVLPLHVLPLHVLHVLHVLRVLHVLHVRVLLRCRRHLLVVPRHLLRRLLHHHPRCIGARHHASGGLHSSRCTRGR
jgi:hypothetical protein